MLASGQYSSRNCKNASLVNLWDFGSKSLIHTFGGNHTYAKMRQLLFTPDSKFLIAVDFHGLFIVWDVHTFETIFVKKVTNNDPKVKQFLNIDSVAILKTENIPDSCSKKHKCYTFLLSIAHRLHRWTLAYSVKRMEYTLVESAVFYFPPNKTFNRELTSIAISGNTSNGCFDSVLAAATTNIGEIFLFNVKNKCFLQSFQVCSRGANACLFLSEDELIVGGGDGSVSIFALVAIENRNKNGNTFKTNDSMNWEMVDQMICESAITNLQILTANETNKRTIIVTTDKSQVYRININCDRNGRRLMMKENASIVFTAHSSPVMKVVFGSFSHMFATITKENGIISIWDLANHSNIIQIPDAIANGCSLSYCSYFLFILFFILFYISYFNSLF